MRNGRLLVVSITTFMLAAVAATTPALAQDDILDEGSGDDSGGDDSSSGNGGSTSVKASGGGGKGFKYGIDVVFPTGGDNAADLIYFLNPNTALDLRIGVAFGPGAPDPMTGAAGDEVFGVDLALGYRMYKPMKGQIRPFLEPGVRFSVADFSAFGDVLGLGVFAVMGVELVVWEQFSLGSGIGVVANFDNAFDTIDIHLITSPIIAGFRW